MRTLSKIGWFCLGLSLALWGIAFVHYGGLENTGGALMHMLGAAFWGGIVLAGLFIFVMSLLFLRA